MARRLVSFNQLSAFFMLLVFGAAAMPVAAGELYITSMTPTPGITDSLGYGSATLLLAADHKSAVLRFSYSNLTTPKVSEHIHAAVDKSIIFDIDNPQAPSPAPQPLPDGSYLWVFDTSPTAPFTAAQIVTMIQTGQTYINIHTSKYPNGEIKGALTLANGSQTFTPPPPAPAFTLNPPSPADASRFLSQAGFGGTLTEINLLSNTGASNASTAINDWLTSQFATQIPIAFNPPSTTQPAYVASTTPGSAKFSTSSLYKTIFDRITTPQAPNAYADSLSTDRIMEAWWGNAITGKDQLRQRVATAYSEIFVVSEIDSTLPVPGLAVYYDMLADDAFLNFRQLLEEITLCATMGDYLNMMGNAYSTARPPNENYAREIMQLFSIGLYKLQPDGTLKLDVNGLPIATYDQNTITNMAHVFTGWNRNGTAYVIPTLPAPNPTTNPVVVVNYNSYYQKPMVLTVSQHSPKAKQLLSYLGAAKWGGGATTQESDPVTIPANSSQSATTVAAELKFTLDNIFNHPNVGPFISKLLIQRLVTSNPSRGYVYRVAQVFNDDGTSAHVRGNMKAVIAAILTDYEARSPAIASTNQFAGHMREPLIRLANVLRPLQAYSKTGKWRIGATNNALNQTFLRSPTVFNFFPPDFAQPGPVQSAGLASPEFGIIYETTISNSQNLLYTGVYSPNYGNRPVTGTGFKGDNYGSDVYLDISPFVSVFPSNSSAQQTNYWVDLLFTPTGATATTQLFPTTAAPVAANQNVNNTTVASKGGIELGLKFKSDVAGVVNGVRFWKGTQNTGTHTGELWATSAVSTLKGTLLASATFSSEGASGWQTVRFATAVPITANTVYIVSYHTTASYYAATPSVFATAGIDTPPLHALSSPAASGNGCYAYDNPAVASLVNVAKTSGVGAMIDQVALLLNNGPLDPPDPNSSATPAKTIVQNFITSNVSTSDYLSQVKAAIYLIATSAQCAAEK